MNISDFKANLKSGGARSNQFTVELNFPPIAGLAAAGRAASFLCNATSLPPVTIENIQLMYRGRPVNFAGERTFVPWTVTVINDGNFLVRNALENWSAAIANLDSTAGLINPVDYQVDMRVIQLDRNGAQLKTYKFFDAYPTELGPIALSYETPTIQTFECTFVYNFYRVNE